MQSVFTVSSSKLIEKAVRTSFKFPAVYHNIVSVFDSLYLSFISLSIFGCILLVCWTTSSDDKQTCIQTNSSCGKVCTFASLWRLCCHASLFTPVTCNERPPAFSLPRTSLKSSVQAFCWDLWGRREFKVQGLFETLACSHACLCCNVVTLVPFPSLFYIQVYKTYNHVPLSFRVKWSFWLCLHAAW